MKKCIVLDLDSTLIYATKIIIENTEEYNLSTINTSNCKYYIYKRPFLKEFIEKVIESFKYVVVWSAGTYEYVHKICNELFKDYDDKPNIIFTRDDCTILDGKYRYKDLAKVAEEIKGVEYNEILILEDDIFSLEINGHNMTKYIKRYEPSSIEDVGSDRELYKVLSKLW